MSDANRSGGAPDGRRKSPAALIVWVLILIFFGFLFYSKFSAYGSAVEWDQSKFEAELAAGRVVKVRITPESDSRLAVEGEFALEPGEKPAAAPDGGAAHLFRSRVLVSDRLNELLEKTTVEVRNPDTWLNGLLVSVLPVVLVLVVLYFLLSHQLKSAGRGAMQFGKSKARMIFPDENNRVTFEDVAGADEAKEETMEVVEYLKDPLKFKMVGGKIPKGALLMGPPGTGKTLLAKAVAGEAKVPFFSISGSDFVEMFVGVGASRVRDMFEQARQHSPCLIFIDEIDAVGRSRFSGIGGGHDEREQTLNAMLVEMDGLETMEGVIILAATNRPDVLDPALLRPGRFDRQITIDLPDINGRNKILDVHAAKIKVADGVDLKIIARGTPGYSGADLANVVNEAALLAARHNRAAATMEDFEEARDKVRWGRERRSRKISDRERRITAYHEAGHALVAMNCEHSMPIHKVTIIPRGVAYLGATMHLPEEDRYTRSKQEMLDEIATLMGGRVAEELIFDDITSGAASDIECATNIARGMACAFGMSERLGAVQYGRRSEHVYPGRDAARSEYSEETAREIDLVIKDIVSTAKRRATDIITRNHGNLEKLATELLDRETLNAAEIRKLLGIKAPVGTDGVLESPDLGLEI